MGLFSDFGDFLSDPLGKKAAREDTRAQQAAYTNLNDAIRQWETYIAGLDQTRAPWDAPMVDSAIAQQRDMSAGQLAEDTDRARRLTGASGLGGGALATQERLIREEMARRNSANALNIRNTAQTANSAFDQTMADLRGQATGAITSIRAGSPVDLTQPPGRQRRPTGSSTTRSIYNREPTVSWGGR
jgi:hypothetical protein